MRTLAGTATDGDDCIVIKRRIADWLVTLLRRQFPDAKPSRLYEIGVKQGMLTEQLLLRDPGLFVIGIDRWEPAGAKDAYRTVGDPAACAPAHEHVAWFGEARRRTESFATRCRLVRSDSLSEAAELRPKWMHGVYLDADHTYDARLADLRAWVPKVMPRGLVAGGLWASAYGGDCCARAVGAFIHEMGWNVALEFGPMHTWGFVRP